MSILDLPPGIGQVRYMTRFELVDRLLEKIGDLHPRAEQTVVANSTSSPTPRTLSGFTLDGSEANEVNPYVDLIRPVMVFQDGSSWPCGVFMMDAPSRHIHSWHTPFTASLLDQTLLLRQECVSSFGVGRRRPIRPALESALIEAGVQNFSIGETDARVGDPILWPAGTEWLVILEELCQLAGFFRPYFNNSGTCVLREVDELVDGPHVHNYLLDREGGSRVISHSPIESLAIDTPGAWRVIGSGPTQTEVVATAYVDPKLPWSRERRGFLIQSTVRAQGIETTGQALSMARSLVAQAAEREIRFSGPPDPRHDTFDQVLYGPGFGEVYRETGWRLPLYGGGVMTHDIGHGGVFTDGDLDG